MWPTDGEKTLAGAGSLALIAWLLLAGPAGAQLSAGFSVASFQFNLSNPGARSLAMGGAFTGRADDATAAYANPAGLTILDRPELSFEGRTAKFRLPLVAAEPILNGFPFSTFDGVRPTGFARFTGVSKATPLGAPDATDSTASFISVVYPHRGWTFALFRHQLADLQAADRADLPPVTTDDLPNPPEVPTEPPGSFLTTTGWTETGALVDIRSLGFAAARRLGERISVGVTLVRNEASIEARRVSEFFENGVLRDTPSDQDVRFDSLVRADDSDWTVNAGLLARLGNLWVIGISYRQGPTFPLSEVETVTERLELGDIVTVVRPPTTDFRVPDVLSLGASVRATAGLIVSTEWDRVGYSRLRAPTVIPATLDNFGREEEDPERLARLGRFTVDDADELRVGLEYSFWRLEMAPAIRLGLWHDPEHKVRFEAAVDCPGGFSQRNGRFECRLQATNPEGDVEPEVVAELYRLTSDATTARALELLYPRGEDELHWTGGFGVVLRNRIQLDAAFDYVSSDRYTLSLSGVVRF